MNLDKAIEIQPNSIECWNLRGVILCDRLQRYEDSLSSFKKAICIDHKNEVIWFNHGNSLGHIGRFKDAILSYRKAIKFKPDYHEAWHGYGVALNVLGDNECAVSRFDKAIKFKPDFYEAWNNRGAALQILGNYKGAIASYEKAIEFRPDYPEAWYNRGVALQILGNDKGAIASYEKAIEFKPDYHAAWFNHGTVLEQLGDYENAIASWEKALECEPDNHRTWNSCGIILCDKLGRYEDAVLSFEKALLFNSDNDEYWYNYGNSLAHLGKYEDAIISFDKAIKLSEKQFFRAWENKGNAYLRKLEYSVAISTWEEGIQALNRDNIFGRGELHLCKGRTQYGEALKQPDPFPELRGAYESFDAAIQCFKIEEYPELHLEACAGLLQVCHQISDQKTIRSVLQQSTEKLNRLLTTNQLNLGQKQTLRRKFISFDQHQVDFLATENPSQAVERIEACKHLTLDNLHSPQLTDPPVHISYSEIQQLLTPTTAIIYWHLSPNTLTTFILKLDQPPILLHPSPPQRTRPLLSPETTAQRQRLEQFEAWMQCWKHHYQTARKNTPNPNSPWRAQMPAMLYSQLRDLLDITRLHQDHLQDIENLILFPHRDLHLLPLHALFPQRFTITYLPSAQTGLNLRQSQPITHRLLNIEDPATDLQGKPGNMLFATLESQAIAQLYRHTLRLTDTQVTHTRLATALTLHSGCLHFTGHSYHDFDNPLNSALALAGDERLTLQDLFQLDLSPYHLVCLSACETGLTSPQSIVDEYIGIVSGFLAAGVQTVVSTLWTVDEISSALLMIRFHQRLKNHPPAIALSQAQDWLKTSTYQILIPWLQNLTTQLAKMDPVCAQIPATALREMQTNAQDQGLDHTPYDHPYYWAGYTLTGLPSPRS